MASVWELLNHEFDHFGRRVRGLAMISRGIVPNLVISQRVVDRVVEAARRFLADETGETMVGFILPPEETPDAMPTLYVVDTIAPDESVIRRSHMFEQGDELQQDIYAWLLDNWDAYREIGRDMKGRPIKPEWDRPLRHMGDWHKQPGFMIQPSGGDLVTALNFMADPENDFEFLLVPIVTLGHDSVTNESGAAVNYFNIPMEDGTSLRMDWWYIHRDSRFFQPITPTIVPEKDMPILTPYPWHLLNADLLDDELDILEDNGYFRIGDLVLWNTDDDLPLEICLIVGRPGTSAVYLVVTDWDYPRHAPKLFLAEFKNIDAQMYIYKIWEQLWASRRDIPPLKDFTWTQETFIVDMIMALDARLGLPPARKAAAPSPAASPASVKIPVKVEEKKARPSSTAHADEEKTDDV
jgi:hypothetical protein